MANLPVLAGVGRALMFDSDLNLIGVSKSLTDNTFNHALSTTEIRGGAGNALLAKYFHDSGLTVTLTDALFDLNHVAMTLGTTVVSGGVDIMEESLTVSTSKTVTLSKTPVAFDGTIVGWYKELSDENWSLGSVSGTTMTVSGATAGGTVCVKYFYNNDNAKKLTIKVDRVPSIVHLVIINDLFSGKPTETGSTKWGKLITDIPSFQFSGEQDLSLNATSAASVSLTGTALAVENEATCEDDLIYGTMVQVQTGADWRNEAIALAAANADCDLKVGETDTAVIYAIFGGNVAASRKANSYFNFTTSAASSILTVDATGLITAKGAGTGTIEVSVKADGGTTFDVEPCYIIVTITT